MPLRFLENSHRAADCFGRYAKGDGDLRHGIGSRSVGARHRLIPGRIPGLVVNQGKRYCAPRRPFGFHERFRSLHVLVLRYKNLISQQDLVAGSVQRVCLPDTRQYKRLICLNGTGASVAEPLQELIACQPFWRRFIADKITITAPSPLIQRFDDMCTEWIQHDVPGHFQKITFLLHQDCFVAPLKQVPDELMPSIDMLRIHPVELTYALRKICFGRFDQQMVVIGHLAKAVDDAVVAFTHLRKNLQPNPAIGFIAIDRVTPVTA